MTLTAPNATQPEEALAAAVEQAFEVIPVDIDTLWDPARCPAQLLPWLAWALSVDEWDPDWGTGTKRDVLAASVEVHRHKGTLGSIKRALSAAGYGNSTVVEGTNAIYHDGTHAHDGSQTYGQLMPWATYQVLVERPMSFAQGARVRRILEQTAPAHCEMTRFDFTEVANIHDGTITYDGAHSHGVV